jgi:PhzF family phenazine biosynthesis protein
MPLTLVQVDAFTDRRFRGNPAAVCLLPEPASETWMQDVAREMNLSETAFLVERQDGYSLRWFTPTVEVDLCGHATLASAHVLWELGRLGPGEPARFHTRSGLLTAERRGEWIEMDFPADPVEPCPAPAELARALGSAITFSGRSRLHHLVEIDSEDTLKALKPDIGGIASCVATQGLIVTSRGPGGTHDFSSRYFAPRAGVPEDPVTGSAHCALGPYWANRLGRDNLVGYQASARGGIVRVRIAGPRVKLAGQAVTVLRGELV